MKLLLALVILAFGLTPVCADQAADEAAIREIQARWDDAWNRHDVQAWQLQTQTHAMQFKESIRTVTGTEIKFLTPDIGIAHVSWEMRGDKNPDGTARQPRNGVMIQVLVKRDGKWTVVAGQNTNIR